MKILQTLSVLSISTLLVACSSDPFGFSGPEVTHLRDAAGRNLYDCAGGSLLEDSGSTEDYWERNNLPYGTTEFVCKKDGKPYLPVDCQGNSLNDKQIRAYWKEHDIPKGVKVFNCENGEYVGWGVHLMDCQGNHLNTTAEILYFWRDNQLPEGTTKYTCVDGKPIKD